MCEVRRCRDASVSEAHSLILSSFIPSFPHFRYQTLGMAVHYSSGVILLDLLTMVVKKAKETGQGSLLSFHFLSPLSRLVSHPLSVLFLFLTLFLPLCSLQMPSQPLSPVRLSLHLPLLSRFFSVVTPQLTLLYRPPPPFDPSFSLLQINGRPFVPSQAFTLFLSFLLLDLTSPSSSLPHRFLLVCLPRLQYFQYATISLLFLLNFIWSVFVLRGFGKGLKEREGEFFSHSWSKPGRDATRRRS